MLIYFFNYPCGEDGRTQMNRFEFRAKFNCKGPVTIPVIHVLSEHQATLNIQTAIDCGCQGVFLINHDFEKEKLIPIIKVVRKKFPKIWLGINFLAVTGKDAFPILGELQREGTQVDGYWADDARIDEMRAPNEQLEAENIDKVRTRSGWTGIYIGGTAFKKQREVLPKNYGVSARIASNHMDIIVTSGIATGQAADVKKIKVFRENCGETALALASGITPENASEYLSDVDLFMVATGINYPSDFYNIDPKRLNKLMKLTQN